MDIKDLKQILVETVDKVETIANIYSGKMNKLKEMQDKYEINMMYLEKEKSQLSELVNKYSDIESLDEARENANFAIKAMEDRANELSKERADFEKYKSKELEKLKKELLKIDDENSKLKSREIKLQSAIKDFNEQKEKFNMKIEGPAHF